ncbi:FUN14-domain-containing protein [Backusella circina FSU 941]|nr:FUN14-domain-containing protein [Backusella circina FSU 941]
MFRLTKPMQLCVRHTKLPTPIRSLTASKRIFTKPGTMMPKVLLLTTLTGSSSLIFKRPVQCQAFVQPATVRETPLSSKEPLLNKGELSFGAALGVCTGYFAKKISKLIVLCVGLVFVFLQYLSSKGYVNVDWRRMERGYQHQLDTDHDGKVTLHDLSVKRDSFMDILTRNVQFKSSFLVGFLVGARYG